MSTEKLPEWPDAATVDFQDTHDSNWYFMEESAAALARMEALVEYAQHEDWCTKWSGDSEGSRWLMDHAHCTCGLDALLASCARKEAGR